MTGKMKGFRARTQKSGKTYYYLGVPGRKEIALGSDYITAVRKWIELTDSEITKVAVTTFPDLADRYEREIIPLKAKTTQATQKGDMKMLREFFGNPPAPLDEIRPKHIKQLLDWKKSKPTTANRLKRLFSHIFNTARGWGYTDNQNPVTGIKGFELEKREVYISDAVFKAVWSCASAPLQDAMDLTYLTGQRPGDVLKMTERDIEDGFLLVKQGKTKARRRISIEGELATLLARIKARKDGYKVWCANLTVNTYGMMLTKQTLREAFETARATAAEANPKMADEIKAFWFYDLRAKAADDVSEERGDQEASDLLGHTSTAVTKKHYIRLGKKVKPTR